MWSILYTLLFTITNDELSALFSGTARTRTGKRNAQGVKIVHLWREYTSNNTALYICEKSTDSRMRADQNVAHPSPEKALIIWNVHEFIT